MDKHKAIPQGYMTVGEVAKKMDVSITLKGAESKELIPAIPFHEIKKAIRFSLPGLISSFKMASRPFQS